MNHLEMNHLKISNRNDGHSKKRLVGRAGELEGTEARGLKLKKFSKTTEEKDQKFEIGIHNSKDHFPSEHQSTSRLRSMLSTPKVNNY